MLALKNVSKSFGTEEVLNNINLEIKDDEIVSILGKSGSGKTTLLNLILGILQPTSGEILYDDENITKVPMEKRGFNIVFQDYALFPHLNVRKNITYGLRNFPDISTPEEVDELIRFLDIEAHVDKKIHQLSGGQKQRVSIARTLVMKPRILLMDEPLSALDGVIKEQIKNRIQEIAKKYHLTTIIVTHDPEEALTVSDRVLILNQGKIEQFDTPAAIISNPSSKYVDDFILNQLRMKKANIDQLFNTNGQVVGQHDE